MQLLVALGHASFSLRGEPVAIFGEFASMTVAILTAPILECWSFGYDRKQIKS